MKVLNFKTKMILMLVIVLGFFTSLGFVGISNLGKVIENSNKLYEEEVVPNHMVQNMVLDLFADLEAPIQSIEKQPTISDDMFFHVKEKMNELQSKADHFTEVVGKTKKQNDLSIQITNDLKSSIAKADAILLFKKGGRQQYNHIDEKQLYVEFDKSLNTLNEDVRQIVNELEKNSRVLEKESDNLFVKAEQQTYFLIFFGFVLILVLMILMIMNITKKYKLAYKILDKLSKGNLDFEIQEVSQDELGMLVAKIGQVHKTLKDITFKVSTAINNISIAGHDLSSSSQSISQGASEQASSVEEVSSSMEQMVSTIHQNAGNATKAAQFSKKLADKTGHMVEASSTSKEKLASVAKKISIINEIAFQTNILALNAAVEAARAGEHGKGFGVVAAEVGKLAERTKEAAHQIGELVTTSSVVIGSAVDIMADSVPEISETSDMIQSIAMASEEQRMGADQINDAIQQLNEVTQQNAATSEEIATSSEELSAQADHLFQTFSFFKFDKDEAKQAEPSNRSVPSMNKKIPQNSSVKGGKKRSGGVNINLSGPDDLDGDYERF